MTGFTYRFDDRIVDPSILGGKGASLARMSELRLPIPPGFTIGTAAWREARQSASVPHDVKVEIVRRVNDLGLRLGQAFDDVERPLLVSVRSGAPVSMPGMMDTILNLGLTDDIVSALVDRGRGEFALASYLRLLETFAEIVVGLDAAVLAPVRAMAGKAQPPEQVQAWKALLAAEGQPLPQTGIDQLMLAVVAVWRSWDSPRAKRYRAFKGIDDDLGTAVTVQAMVFGNRDSRSGTGVVFTRDPATGAPGSYGDFLLESQGEDVVDGSVTPISVAKLETLLPKAAGDLRVHLATLEQAYEDLCDVEFTIESDVLWILQARPGQRSSAASVRIAVDMVDEGLISVDAALKRVPVTVFEDLSTSVIADSESLDVLGTGVPASPGVAVGRAVFDTDEAERAAAAGHDVILLRAETSSHDIGGMIASAAIVTARGGRASHAAVVARGIGRPAVCGVDGLDIDDSGSRARLATGETIVPGDVLTIDGTAGALYRGAAQLERPKPRQEVQRLLEWCDDLARVPVITDIELGFTLVADVGEVASAGRDIAIELDWQGASSNEELKAIVRAIESTDAAHRLVFVVPDSFRGTAARLPRARWAGVVARKDDQLAAARLLAATVEVQDNDVQEDQT